MDTRMEDGMNMARSISMMATTLTNISCVRLETFPEIAVDESLPTSIRSQYTAATAPATAVAFSVIPDTELSER